MTVKGINFRSLLFAGFTAGYIMFFIDKWFQGFLGLFGMFPGTSSAWWMLEHHIDSILFGLIFAWPAFYYGLPRSKWLKGIIFGFLWWLAVSIASFIGGAGGAAMFQQMPLSAGIIISNLLLHLIWGFILGILYYPEEQITAQEVTEVRVK